MESCKKNRRVVRAAFTKCFNVLERLLSADSVQLDLINVEYDMLQQKHTALRVLDEEIYAGLLETNAEEEDLASEMDCSDGYEKKFTTLRLQWEKISQQQQQQGENASIHGSRYSDDASQVSNKMESGRRFKLPTIEFKKFNGDIREWLSFWAQFRKIDEDNYIDECDKISYLFQATVPGSRARQLVESFPAVPGNYTKMVDSLKSRFGREDLQIEVYIREFLKLILNNALAKTKTDISTLYDKIETQLRALETLGITKSNCVAMLFPLIESCLPEYLLRAWQRSPDYSNSSEVGVEGVSNGVIPLKRKLDSLMSFLKVEVESEQRINLASENFGLNSFLSDKISDKGDKGKNRVRQYESKVPTAAGLVNIDEKNTVKCLFCEAVHLTENCFKAQNYSLDQKRKVLADSKACFRCLKRGHQSRMCKGRQRCLVCSRSHVTFMCPDLPVHKGFDKGASDPDEKQSKDLRGNAAESKPVEHSLATHSNVSGHTKVFLQTLFININNGSISKKIRVLIDSGSHRSYILKSTAQELGFDALRSEKLIHSLFGGHCTAEKNHNCYKVKLSQNNYSCTLEVLDQPQICNDIPPAIYGSWVDELRSLGVQLSDCFEPGSIELLIGADVAAKLYTGRMHVLSCGLVALETVLGWTIMGKVPSENRDDSLAMTTFSMFVKDLPDLWKLDVLGITEPTERKTRDEMAVAAREMFTRTVSVDPEGRYKVNLPWLEGHPPLPSYLNIARRRLNSTIKRLENDDLLEDYGQIFDEWKTEGIIELVPPDQIDKPALYLPHRPVIKEASTTKIRPVFDASACEKGKPSLNSCLEVGPNLIERIPSILLRFRRSRIGVISDIRKAFLQITLDESDQDFLRFLWIGPDKKEVVYRHRRVVFGVSSSPFLLGATLEHHLHLCKQKCVDSEDPAYSFQTIEKLEKSFYVDNCVASVKDKSALNQFINESVALLEEAKMDLRGWEYTGKNEFCDGVSVLGLTWLTDKDVLKIRQDDALEDSEVTNEPVTKRIILSRTQKVFDPIGFTCAAMVCPKILLQQTFEAGLSWDTPVDEQTQNIFRNWEKELSYLQKIEIPRWIQFGSEKADHLSLHTFCDASKQAYAAVVFLRVDVQEEVRLFLVTAKSRVAPLKNKLTIPRLELLAATIGARLCDSLKTEFNRNIDLYFWSDSTTVISWIRRAEEWATFVGNRVKEIRSLSRVEAWRHVPGQLNPADLPSRGCSPKHLFESQWWEGPAWLREKSLNWPQQQLSYDEHEINQERKKGVVTMMLDSNSDFWHFHYFHQYSKTLRMIAWIFRFIDNTRYKKHISGPLGANEINRAEKFILKIAQSEGFPDNETFSSLNAFKDEEGLFRVRTLVSNRKDVEDFCYPVILPGKHALVKLLIIHTHEQSLHVGTQGLLSKLRERYWITGGRRVIRAAISSCIKCKRQSAKSFRVPAPPLPIDRVRDAVPFEVTGMDFAGPLYLKDGEKVWVCLFTCAVYRAVHMELVTSMSTMCFIQAFRRFVARYGRPTTVYTDNGTNFVGAENLLAKVDWNSVQDYASSRRITWRFNPPTAAWWGGFWERLVGILKSLLRKVLGRASLAYEELLTLVCECEDIINSRPITYVSSESSDLVALTPSMFLRDSKYSGVPDCDAVERTSLCRKIRYRQKLRDDLRRRFRNEYLGQLQSAHVHKSGRKPRSRDIKVGEIVLVGNDSAKRLEWPLARVIELLPGRDGNTRLVRVLTSKGQLLRPVQRLFSLECDEEDSPDILRCKETCSVSEVTDVPILETVVNKEQEVANENQQYDDGVRLFKRSVKLTRSGRISKFPQKYSE